MLRKPITGGIILLFLLVSLIPIVTSDSSTLNNIIYVDDDGGAGYTKIQNEENYDLLILTPRDFSDDLQPLVEHKEHYGIITKTVTLDDVYESVYFPVNGRDNAEKIKYFIKSAKENWSVSYVMLVGGEDEMPARYLNTRIISTPFISDLYYADIYNSSGIFCSWDSNDNSKFGELAFNTTIDEVDLYPDVYVGRLLCHTSSDVEVIVNKIVNYEKNTYNQSWFKNLILCGGDTKPIMTDLVFKWIAEGEGKIAFEGEFMGERVIENMTGFYPNRLYASSILFNKDRRKVPSCKNINAGINNGAGFLLFSGHGSPFNWGTHPPFLRNIWMPFPLGYTSIDVQKLENGDKLPIAIFSACSCGDFSKISGLTDPIAWKIIGLENGGAIASFACTTESSSLPGTLCTKTLSGYITTHIFRAYSAGKNMVGELLARAITDYLNDEEATSKYFALDYHYECMECWMLFGDPSLKIGGYP